MLSTSLYADASSTLTPTQATSNVATLVVVLVFALGLTFLYTVPLVVALWKLFRKAGQPGWAAIVPFYNYWVEVKIARAPMWLFWVLLVLSLSQFIFRPLQYVAVGFGIYLIVLLAKQYDRSAGFWWLLYLLPIVGVFKVKDATYKSDPAASSMSTPMGPANPVGPTAPVAPAEPAPVAPVAPVTPPAPVDPAPTTQPPVV